MSPHASAFPIVVAEQGSEVTHGISIRTYIAARMFQALLPQTYQETPLELTATVAVRAADALIAELNKLNQPEP